MGSVLVGLASGVASVVTIVIAALITIIAVRGTRNHSVGTTSQVLDSFSINPDSTGGPVIQISGRRKGAISWILTNLGMENRIELTVTESDWTLREGSLAGTSVVYLPLKNIRATICGYQRSILALFLMVFFALNAGWALIAGVPYFLRLFGGNPESGVETASSSLSVLLFGALIGLFACGIAGLFYLASKRVAFGVESGKIRGIVFKRSFIENKVIDLAEAERATSLLNQLVSASVYGLPRSQTLSPEPGRSKQYIPKRVWWIIAASYLGLAIVAVILNWYGDGVSLRVKTIPVGAAVFVDGQYLGTTSSDTGIGVFPHRTREVHTLELQADGYQPLSQTVSLSRFESSRDFTPQLTLLNFPFTVYSNPSGVRVAVDGKDAGVTDEKGILLIPKMDRGTHQLSMSRDGYRSIAAEIQVNGRQNYRVDLVNEEEAALQEVAVHQQDVTTHVDRGRMLFGQGQYKAALDECDAALKVDPANGPALALKSQIEQTRKILGQ